MSLPAAAPRALYNEIDDYAADWLENLISRGLICPGVVDRRSIVDLRPADLVGYNQVHLFAGIGIWSYGMRRAGIPDSANVWTGSCPCQPFSAAGKGGGFTDERHLWPAFHHLIEQCRPDIVLGEQVASKDGLAWLDLVQSDLEGTGYAFGPSDTCSAGFGAPHIRQRLRFVAYSQSIRGRERLGVVSGASNANEREVAGQGDGDATWSRGSVGQLADMRGAGLALGSIADDQRGTVRDERATTAARLLSRIVDDANRVQGRLSEYTGRPQGLEAVRAGSFDGVADSVLQQRSSGQSRIGVEHHAPGRNESAATIAGLCLDMRPGPVNGFWRDCDWLYCRDGKWRPVESGTFPLAHGDPARVGRLRAYGNAVDGEATAEFCGVVADALGLR